MARERELLVRRNVRGIELKKVLSWVKAVLEWGKRRMDARVWFLRVTQL